MANIPLKSIKFPDLDDTYTVPSNAGELPYNKSAAYPADTVGKALQNIGDSSAPAIIETAQGSIASFTDGANVPVKDLVAEIVPIQSGSGDPSPSNVRAISGWTEANISVTGVNVWDEEWELGTIDTSGNPTSSSATIRSKNYIPCLPSTTYYYKSGSKTSFLHFYDTDKNWISYTSKYNETFTTPANAYYMLFRLSSGTTYNHDISINYPSTDHDYHAYNGETHTISFGQTVYGGTLDVTSGVLTVDKAIVANMGSMNWVDTGSGDSYRFYTSDIAGVIKAVSQTSEVGDLDCEVLKPASYGDVYAHANDNIISVGTNGYIYAYASSYANLSAFKTALDNVKLVYPLATPQTYQLTPTEVKSLLKNNNIWADTGDVTVEYVADTKTFIENLVNA